MYPAVFLNNATQAAADARYASYLNSPNSGAKHGRTSQRMGSYNTEDEPPYAIVPLQHPRHPLTSQHIVKAPPRRHPNATESQRLLLSEVDRMPSTTAKSKTPTRSEPAVGKRHVPFVDVEEERLLGGIRRNKDAGAVPIGKPTTRPFTQVSAVKIPSGGPRPINTLNGHSQSTGPRANQAKRLKPRAGIQNTLQTKISRGGNVRGLPHVTELNTNFELPSAKRQKTKHQSSSPSPPQSIIDPLDNEAPNSVTFRTPSQSASRAPSAPSQGSGFQLRRDLSSTGSVQELKNVELMMNSNPISKKKQRRLNSHSQQQDQRSPDMSYSNPIDLSGDDDEMDVIPKLPENARVLYQGTMKDAASTRRESGSSRIMQGVGRGEQSPFFPFTTRANGPLKQQQDHSTLEDNTRDRSRRLNNMFIQVDGLRRGSEANMSSDLDELQEGGNTVGHTAETNAALSTIRSRQSSPIKVTTSESKLASSPELSQGLPKSNIKSSTFATRGPKIEGRAQKLIGRIREKKAPWAIEVAALSHAGELYESSSMGLVYYENDKCYAINRDGKRTTIRIQPDKLQRIQYAEEGGKVRFQSSKSGIEENVLDLQFGSEKDACDLVKRLADQTTRRAESFSRHYMDRIFEKRRQEFQKNAKFTGTKGAGLVNIEPPPSPWQEGIDGNSTSSSIANATRRRQNGRLLVEELAVRAGQDNTEPTGNKTKATINRLIDEASVSEVLKIIRPQPHNDHLRRSTRTYRAANKGFEDSFDDLENGPERYSQVHSMGEPWKRPLTFPKEGKKRITVEWSDLEKLDEGEFLNDSLISFYLRFLEQQVGHRRPEIAKKVYFFNTYFYATLTNTHKSKKGFNYEGVQKWTRSVDLFTYDYIIVPINESMHWYLAIICNLPTLDRSLEMPEEITNSPAKTDHESMGEKAKLFRPPSSSPDPGLSPEQSAYLSEDVKGVEETETRNSFAEMSLNKDTEWHGIKSADVREGTDAQAADQHDQDQEMLDAQFEATMPGSTATKAEVPAHAKEQIKSNEDPVEDLDRSPTVPGKSKKQKRKSIPPSITKTDPTKPAIIMLDSIGVSRSHTIRILKDYLHEEARTKRGGMEFDDGQIKGMNAKVPQQSNYSDCGLFLLGYVEKFLENNPRDFIANIIARSYDEEKDWVKLVPSTMRASIREQLQRLQTIQEAERQSAKKISKSQEKGNQKTGSSPTRTALRQFDTPNPEADNIERTATSRPAQQPPFDTLEPASPSPSTNTTQHILKGEKDLEDVRHSKQHGQPKSAIIRQDDPSVIEIESQSQTAPSVPRSTRPSPPILNSPGTRPDEEFPSEVPDSQPSAPSKSFEPSEQTSTSPKRSETVQSFENILGKSVETKKAIVLDFPTTELGKRDGDGSARRNTMKKKVEECGMIDVINVDD